MSEAAKLAPRPQPPRLFNTPVECGFRLLFILSASRPALFDVQRLISYDYLLVHSGDVDTSYPSLHPAVPNRGAEWVIKRQVVDTGLSLMCARELVIRNMTDLGIYYSGSDLTSAFVGLLKTSYAEGLRDRAKWLAERFDSYTDERLQSYMAAQVGEWGAEFDTLSALKDVDL
ncbi:MULTISPECIES: ABC-three component system middle component 2 [Hyphomicrobiales]|jgi:hypothetical protein|uniref:ABC-three component system middle component 2 n=1 Tax=Hyphomicrobiales TaxID=356 RepID=UPI0010FA13C9|nr:MULTISPECIES: ABC-three component system middle component 2 [Mesorhizobium]MBA3038735.1 hypothetical protein [Rhizobiaceae bacterium]MBA4799795.1 hypothetical protein [Hyphomicrobiales bacterium]MBN9217065.1 hypothetical protein [Mesorhizobium sp.]